MTTEPSDPSEDDTDLPLPLSIIKILKTRDPLWVYNSIIKDWPKLEGLSETLRLPVSEWRP